MIRNYLKIALRQLIKNKAYVIINTLGMGIALACCMAAYIFVAFNIEFNDYFDSDKTSNMATVMSHFEHQNGEPYQNMNAPAVMAPIAAEEITGIKRYLRFVGDGGNISYNEEGFAESIQFVDSTFFDMFDIPLTSGAHKNLYNKDYLFLGEELAEKIFGPEKDPVGELISLEIRNQKFDFIVGGVVKKLPLNSTFYVNAILRIEHFMDIYDIGPNDWGQWRDASTIFELEDIDKKEEVSTQLAKYLDIRNEMKSDAIVTSYELIPFNEPVTEEEANWSYFNSRIAATPILVFLTLALIILLIACFNLTNTTIAITVKRFKEIGVRKVVGARRYQVIIQFLLEISIAILLAIFAGFGLSQIIVPEFTAMWGIPYGLADLNYVNVLVALIFLLFLSSLLAGAYPAINNSKFKPVSLLKGSYKVKGTNPLTRGLLVAQFSLSVVVLVAGVMFTMNSRYQQNIDMGYDIDNVFIVSIQGEEDYVALKNEILANPKIENVAVTDHHIGYFSYTNPIRIDTSEFETNVYEVGATYFKTMGLEVTEGRHFIDGSELDFEKAAIIDQEFVDFYNLEDPLATKIWFQGIVYDVVGVVQNHLGMLWQNSSPQSGHFYRMSKPVQYRNLVARVENKDDLDEMLEFAEDKWKSVFPGRTFLGRTQDDVVFGNINQTNRNLTVIFLFLTILGCLLSVSGIYSLASLNIEKRTKEIGIRKALGASIHNIIRLINMEFVYIMAFSVALGSFAGVVLTTGLLDEIYAYHIEIQTYVIVLCAVFIFVIGVATTSGTILKAASANPVDTLRDE